MFPQIFGKYVLEREIAAGGMARVLLATLRGAGGFEKRLVVKQIRPELASDQSFIRRFVAESVSRPRCEDVESKPKAPLSKRRLPRSTAMLSPKICGRSRRSAVTNRACFVVRLAGVP
jgi:hypothetical protein